MFIFLMTLSDPEDEVEEPPKSKLSGVSHHTPESEITVSEMERTLLEEDFTPRDNEKGRPITRLKTQRTSIPRLVSFNRGFKPNAEEFKFNLTPQKEKKISEGSVSDSGDDTIMSPNLM